MKTITFLALVLTVGAYAGFMKATKISGKVHSDYIQMTSENHTEIIFGEF